MNTGRQGMALITGASSGIRPGLDMVQRRDTHAFVYVLEGQIVMQLKGQPAVTLKAGQTLSDGPHII